MTIRIRFRGGELTGQIFEFDDNQELVRIGRDPGRCEVVVPASETRVSREHVAIRRVLGRHRLLTNRESTVLVDGQPAHEDQILPALCELTLGSGGPLLLIETLGESELLPTVASKVLRPGVHTRVEKLAGDVRKNRTIAVLVAGLLVTSSLAGWLALRSSSRRIDEVAVFAAQKGTLTQALQLQIEGLANRKDEFTQIYKEREPSVYLVLQRSSAGVEQGVGTAWAVGDRLLATNAHVAEAFLEIDPKSGDTLLARNSKSPHTSLTILSVTLHPGYERWRALLEASHPVDPALGFASVPLVPACDVALMFVDGPLEKPLALASSEEAFALEPGEPIALIGYPMEGLVGGGVDVRRPSAEFLGGRVVNHTTFFLSKANAADELLLIHHNIESAGGSSGSPILNHTGKVIGINSAANVAMVHDPQSANPAALQRIPIGGIHFGQHIELLRELIEQRAEPAQAKRDGEWQVGIQALLQATQDPLFELVLGAFRSALAERGIDVASIDHESDLEGVLAGGGAGAALVFDATLDASGLYLVTAVAGNFIDIDLQVQHGRDIYRDEQTDPMPMAIFQARGGETIQILVWGSQAPGVMAPFRLSIYRARVK